MGTLSMSSGDPNRTIFPKISPDKIQGCDLHEGEWGTVGSVIFWNYVHAKTTLNSICSYTISTVVIEGDLLELYKSFVATLHVDTKGENNLVTWTFEYEKRSEDVEDPNTLMDFIVNLTKDIETHHLK
ncbi:hypothetical protein RJ639_018602 [Escallonia herrerae]|uniref:Bet v I/Major latex protein domain-containing protein n=1 Tax=Escallonia herrerae TaxID=1293975 RepID=A0AA88V8T9_9ASTE|nr:hypothetical protein RJ639_018602 [Escallonia herrerae]